MDVFQTRLFYLDKFIKGHVQFETLSKETANALKNLKKEKNSPLLINRPARGYVDYLGALVNLERRVEVECHLLRMDLSYGDHFRRVCDKYFTMMSRNIAAIILEEGVEIVEEIYSGPNGSVILKLKGSPVGKVYIKRSDFIELGIPVENKRILKTKYLEIIFNFLQTQT